MAIPDKLRCMTSLYLTWEDQVLLLYRQGSRVVNDTWVSAAGGHFEAPELSDARACALRELSEELGLTEGDLQGLSLRYITLRRTEPEIRVNYYFFAQLPQGPQRALSSPEGQLQWFPLSETGALDMPFTSRFVMAHYRTQSQYDDILYGGVADDVTVHFTPMPAP